MQMNVVLKEIVEWISWCCMLVSVPYILREQINSASLSSKPNNIRSFHRHILAAVPKTTPKITSNNSSAHICAMKMTTHTLQIWFGWHFSRNSWNRLLQKRCLHLMTQFTFNIVCIRTIVNSESGEYFHT